MPTDRVKPPALTTIVRFTQSTTKGRELVVRELQRSAAEPFRPIFYQAWFAACRKYVAAGNKGAAFERAVFAAGAVHARSFQICGEGAKKILEVVQPRSAKTSLRVKYHDVDQLLLRVHVQLALVCDDGTTYWCYTHMGPSSLSERALCIIRHTMARVAAAEPLLIAPIPAILHMRRGEIELIDPEVANDDELAVLIRQEVQAFSDLWLEAAA